MRRFDAALAGQTAAEFVGSGLGALGLSGVVVGPDFQFGRGREGDAARLVELCRKHGLSCTVAPVLARDGTRVSSSAIRAALREGDVAEANDLLGHRWFVQGPVRHGEKRGRTLGYPTANMRLPDEAELRHGIYAVRGAVGGETFDGVASFGRRPTFDNGAPLLETQPVRLRGRPLRPHARGRVRRLSQGRGALRERRGAGGAHGPRRGGSADGAGAGRGSVDDRVEEGDHLPPPLRREGSAAPPLKRGCRRALHACARRCYKPPHDAPDLSRLSNYGPGLRLSARSRSPDPLAPAPFPTLPSRPREAAERFDAMTILDQTAAPKARDYSETLFLPQTDFPMRAGLPQARAGSS